MSETSEYFVESVICLCCNILAFIWLVLSHCRSRKVAITTAYGDVMRDVRGGKSAVDRAVKYILNKDIRVPFTEEIFRHVHYGKSVDISRSDLLKSDQMSIEELAVAKGNWDRLLNAVGIKNHFDFAIDLLVM